jgi:hypothetical protein
MKFLALKEALDLAVPTPKPLPPRPELPTIPFYNPDWKKQTVVGGDFLRTPVDKTSAMVIRKAPWWAHPPIEQFQPKPIEPKPVKPKKVKRTMSTGATVHRNAHPAQNPAAVIATDKTNDVLNVDIATTVVSRTKDTIDNLNMLVDKAKDARAALDIMCDYWKADWISFMDQGDERLKQLRIFRMSFDTETKSLMASLREVRQFFMDKTHDDEVKRLKDFVEICERLKALKDSGFLDTVADTMLKLA